MQREGRYTKCMCGCVLYACLCESITITVCVCGHWGPMSWYRSGNRTGPILRTWGTWVDVRGLTESKGLRPGPTKTLTYCVCCLCHCVLENKSFGGDTGSKGYPWAATQAWAFCYMSHVCFQFSHVETILYHSQYSSCIFFSLPCHLPVFCLKWFPTPGNNQGGQ